MAEPSYRGFEGVIEVDNGAACEKEESVASSVAQGSNRVAVACSCRCLNEAGVAGIWSTARVSRAPSSSQSVARSSRSLGVLNSRYQDRTKKETNANRSSVGPGLPMKCCTPSSR